MRKGREEIPFKCVIVLILVSLDAFRKQKKKKHAIIITDMKLFSKHLKTRHINLEESVESLTRRAWGKTGTVLGVDRGKKEETTIVKLTTICRFPMPLSVFLFSIAIST